MDILIALGLSAILLLSCKAIGRAVFDIMRIRPDSQYEALFFHIAAGIAVWIFILSVLALLGCFTLISILAVLLISIVYQLFRINWRVPIYKTSIISWFKRLDTSIKILLGIFVFSAVTSFLQTFLLPTNGDALVCHLALVKKYIQHAGFIDLPYVRFSTFSNGLDLFYGIGLFFGNLYVARILSFSIAYILACALVIFVKKYFNTRIAVLALIIMTATSTFYFLSFIVKPDLGLALFELLCFIFFVKAVKDRDNRYIILMALAAAAAVSTKLTGAVFIGPLYLLLIYYAIRRQCSIYAVLASMLLAFILYVPFLAKSYIFTGNPIYPLANALFTLKPNYQGVETVLKVAGYNVQIPRNVLGYLAYPFALTFRPSLLNASIIGPLFLFMAPVGLIKHRRNPIIIWTVFISFCAATVLFFSIGLPKPRYMFAVFALLSIPAALGYEWFNQLKKLKPIRVAPLAVFWIWIIAVAGLTNANKVKNLQFVFKPHLEYMEEYEHGFPWYRDLVFMNENLPKTACVLLMSSPSFYLDRDFVTAEYFENGGWGFKALSNWNEFADLLRQHKVTHIWDSNRQSYPQVQKYLNEILTARNTQLESIYENPKLGTRVYQIKQKRSNKPGYLSNSGSKANKAY